MTQMRHAYLAVCLGRSTPLGELLPFVMKLLVIRFVISTFPTIGIASRSDETYVCNSSHMLSDFDTWE